MPINLTISADLEGSAVTEEEVADVANALFDTLPEGESLIVEFGCFYYAATNAYGTINCLVTDS